MFGNLDLKIQTLKEELDKLDRLIEAQRLDETEIARCKALRSQLWSWLKLKELYWQQLALTKALKSKDKNTKNKKCIKFHKQGSGMVKNPRAIKKEITKFFKSLYSEDKLVCLR